MNFEIYHLQVFSRWGELLFENKDPNQALKGHYKEGLQAGSYAWQLKVTLPDAKEVRWKATVTLL